MYRAMIGKLDDAIKMDLQEIRWDGLFWSSVVQDGDW
jgi:hypothetical protein